MLEKRRKRANITFFIIVGILILVVLVIFLSLVSRLLLGGGDSQFKKVNVFVDGCFEQSSNNALVYVSKQGGIYLIDSLGDKELMYYDENILKEFSPPNIIDIKGMKLDKEPVLTEKIDKKKYEDDISRATGFLFKQCLNNLSDFKQFDTDQESVEMKVSTAIEKDKVTIKLDYPVTFTLGSGSKVRKMTLTEKSQLFAVRLYDMIELGNILIIRRDTNINIDQAENNFFYLDADIYPFGDRYLYVIKDQAKVGGKRFKLAFVTDNKKDKVV